MRLQSKETEEQRRRRVSSRIRNELLEQVGHDLVELARARKLPNEWMTAERVNELLEDSGYWAAHPHVMASFLSPCACEEVVGKALHHLTTTHPELWVGVGSQYKPAGRDWNAYAVQKADRIRREFPDAERTAYHTGADGACVIFAHDDFQNDPRAREEVSLLRKYLHDNAVPELGFGLSADGLTWVMVVWSQDEAALKTALFDAWQTAFNACDEIKF
jgi:hypothetical protein